MSKFSNFKIKWPKSIEKVDNGGRLATRSPLPKLPKWSSGSASASVHKCVSNKQLRPLTFLPIFITI